MVGGLLRPDAGSVSVDTNDALTDPLTRNMITAWVSEEPMIYDKRRRWEYLEFVAGNWASIQGVGTGRAPLSCFRWT